MTNGIKESSLACILIIAYCFGGLTVLGYTAIVCLVVDYFVGMSGVS